MRSAVYNSEHYGTYTAEISSNAVSFAMGLLACVAVIPLLAGLRGKSSVGTWTFNKIHNADFLDAHCLQHR